MSENKQTMQIAFSAREIAEILAGDGVVHYPTAEQTSVIESGVAGQKLVVAGAGSGKTETVSQRVVWLIANGLVEPQHILGLTFTNKAAGELNERVSARITNFCANALLKFDKLTQKQQQKIIDLQQKMRDDMVDTAVQTYNAFASGIVAEFGTPVGIDASARVIDRARALQIAKQVLRESDNPELANIDVSLRDFAEHLQRLENALTDNGANPADLLRLYTELEAAQELPLGAGGRTQKGAFTEILKYVPDNRILLAHIDAYRARKKLYGAIEFSDQVAQATKIVTEYERAGTVLRDRYRVVLLDEVQDTSVGQTALLAHLFAGGSVMGVGDPHQSIYGWRGAAADGLNEFLRNFSGKQHKRKKADTSETADPNMQGCSDKTEQSSGQVLTLSTSWRNPQKVLQIANKIVAPLADAARVNGGLDIPELQPRRSQNGEITAEIGEVSAHYYVSDETECAATVAWIAGLRQKNPQTSIAVISRGRLPLKKYAQELSKHDIPNQIIGKVGGLLSAPEVLDIIAVLHCVSDSTAANYLIRLLAGPRF
ncbi:MAG: ATP-dependent helicase, partial [Microbacteriaceae bacterium]|nr:ATP-dependent helicase [Microbacteriaceae bacterium]